MRKSVIALLLLAACSFLAAQQVMTNDSVIKLVKAGLSDDLIVTTINSSPGAYDTSTDGIIALKTAGASDKVIGAIITRAAAPAAPSASGPNSANTPPPPADSTGPASQAPTRGLTPPGDAPGKPRVFLQSASKGNQWAAARDQSMEMGKDFDKDCPDVRITINEQTADYTVVLNHIEVGFARDNQFQIADKNGDLISKTKEGGSIDGGVKKACQMILDDWAKNNPASH